MPKVFVMPKGQIIVNGLGTPNIPGRSYLLGIEDYSKRMAAIAALTDLDSGTSYSNDELRDALIALKNALQE